MYDEYTSTSLLQYTDTSLLLHMYFLLFISVATFKRVIIFVSLCPFSIVIFNFWKYFKFSSITSVCGDLYRTSAYLKSISPRFLRGQFSSKIILSDDMSMKQTPKWYPHFIKCRHIYSLCSWCEKEAAIKNAKGVCQKPF